MRQEHNTKVVRLRPIETCSLHQHDAGVSQQLQKELAVVFNGINRRVKLGEHVQSRTGLDATHARNGGDQFIRQVALSAQPAPLTHQVVDALVTAQRGLNGPLAGHVGAQLHVGEHVQALNVVRGHFLVARDHHPTRAVTAGAVAFAQGVEGQRQDVGGQTGHCRVPGIVVQNLVINLIGQYHQTMLAGNLNQTFKQGIRVNNARWVVGIDHHDAFGARRDLGANVIQVGHPAIGFVTHIMHGCAAGETGSGRPQRVVWHGQKQFVAVVEQGVGGHGDQFAGAIAQVNVIQGDASNALFLGFMHDRLARTKNAFAV